MTLQPIRSAERRCSGSWVTVAEPDAFMGLCFRCGARYYRTPSKVTVCQIR